jgi:hypothetical protein
MIIRTSPLTGPLTYDLVEDPRLVDDYGQTFITCTLRNVSAKSQEATVMLTPEEVDRLYAARRKLRK